MARPSDGGLAARLPPSLEGIWCALRSPLWLNGERLLRLLSADGAGTRTTAAPGTGSRPVPGRGPDTDLDRARRAARRALRLLSRVPASPWRATCLYEGVSECLLRRRRRMDATLVLGARRSDDGPLELHAWVDEELGRPGAVDEEAGTGREPDYRPLRPARRPAAGEAVRLELLEGGELTVTAPGSILPLLEPWLPRTRRRVGGEPGASGRIRVSWAGEGPAFGARSGGPAPPDGAREPTFRSGSARAWVDEVADRATVISDGGAARASVELGERTAGLEVSPRLRRAAGGAPGGRPEDPADPRWELSSVLSAVAVLLLGRGGRTLLHGAAAVRPSGGAWLLVGDGGSGKSSACASLVAGGWDYLSDDQLVLRPAGETVIAEGWHEGLHLDEGWGDGEPAGTRRPVSAEELGAGRWRATAPVEGVLLPRIVPEGEASLEPVGAIDVLAGLIRQSPWLMADRAVSERLLGLLEELAELPARELRMGPGAFGRPGQLMDRVSEAAGR